MSASTLLKVYDGQEPDLCFGAAPGPGGVNSVGVGAGLAQTGTAANPVVSLGMSAVGDLLVGTGVANAGAVLSKGANGNFLRVKTDGSGLEYAAVAPGGVDSVSVLANNPLVVSTTAPASATDPKIGIAFAAKGDLVVGTGANTGVILTAGANDYVLTTNSSTTSGLEWKAQGSGSAPIIFRNSVDNVPLTITKPNSANDTCIITADRTYQTFTPAQVYNVPIAAGTDVDATGGLTFFTYTPTADIVVSNIVCKILIKANILVPTPSNNYGSVSVYNGATLVLQGDIDPFGSTSNNLIQFNIPAPSPTTLVAGTAYSFDFAVDTQVSTTIDFVNVAPIGVSYVGECDITGITYLGQPASFTIAPPSKFRITNDTTGKTTATCESYSSQSFIASGDAADWIQIGGTNGGVAYIP